MTTLQGIVLGALIEARGHVEGDMKAALEEAFELVPGRPDLRVRRRAVADHVAAVTGVVRNSHLDRLVWHVGQKLGWEPIKVGNRRLWRGIKVRHQGLEQAAEASRRLQDLCQGRKRG